LYHIYIKSLFRHFTTQKSNHIIKIYNKINQTFGANHMATKRPTVKATPIKAKVSVKTKTTENKNLPVIEKARHSQVYLTLPKKTQKITVTVGFNHNANKKALQAVRDGMVQLIIDAIKKSKAKTDVHYILPVHLDSYLNSSDGILDLMRTPVWKTFTKEIGDNGFYVQWFSGDCGSAGHRDDPLTSFCFNAYEDNGYTGPNYNNISIFKKAPKNWVKPLPPDDSDYGYSW
jgi:hypothetical protein